MRTGSSARQKLLNDGLAKMRANGRMQALIKKWMGE